VIIATFALGYYNFLAHQPYRTPHLASQGSASALLGVVTLWVLLRLRSSGDKNLNRLNGAILLMGIGGIVLAQGVFISNIWLFQAWLGTMCVALFRTLMFDMGTKRFNPIVDHALVAGVSGMGVVYVVLVVLVTRKLW
jgi:hypothetical protein